MSAWKLETCIYAIKRPYPTTQGEKMTIKCGPNLIETDDSVPPIPGPVPGTVIVRVKSGKNWNGNTFENCNLQIPEELLKDAAENA